MLQSRHHAEVAGANTTKPLNMRVTHVPNASTAVFILGPRTVSNFPLFPLHVDPWTALVAPTTVWPYGGVVGYAEVELTIPDDPSLLGLRLALQVACLDPAAPFGISSTDAVELVFGD